MLFIHSFFRKYSIVVVREISMTPTLRPGDTLLVDSSRQSFGRGAIVIANALRPDAGLHIKRVVGLPGDHLAFNDSRLCINETYYPELYLDGLPQTMGLAYQEWSLNDNEYFLLGDNRSHSIDSRSYGPITSESVKGEVRLGLWPFKWKV